MKVTEEMVQAFGEAWRAEDAQKDGFSQPGDRRRAGLEAALATLDSEPPAGLWERAMETYDTHGRHSDGIEAVVALVYREARS